VAKAAAISLVTNYRESYGLFACSGLLFNHESPLRPSRFVTRKVSDWGCAPNHVEAMWIQWNQSDDFVVASGVAHSLEEFVATAFAAVGLN
jgi:GDPmannose 4,6-dehydratase